MAVTPGGGVIGYAWVWGPRRPYAEFDAALFVRPGPGGAPVAATILARMETRILSAAAEAGLEADPAIAIPVASVNRTKRDVLAARGYSPVRTFLRMERELAGDIPAPRWPGGVKVHPLRRGANEAEVHSVLQEAFADHYRFMPEPLEEWARRAFDRDDFVPELSYVARDRGTAVAASTNHLTGNQGWIGMVGVRPAWQRRGLATALLLHSFHALRARGLKSVGLGVDSQNAHGAVPLYERLGMAVTQRHDLYEKRLARIAS